MSIFLNFIPDFFFFQSTLSLVFLNQESRKKLCWKLSLHRLSLKSNSLH